MTKNTRRTARGDPALTRESIVAAAIVLLDSAGESALTFRNLATALGTGAGALYFHIANKDHLVNAACDAIVAQAMSTPARVASARDTLRAIGLAVFDAIEAHPWVGAELARAPGSMPLVRILEAIGQQVRALTEGEGPQWTATSTLVCYTVGVAGQNAANARIGQEGALDRAAFLDTVALAWSGLDAGTFPFARSIGARLREHDDRADFVAGIDLILEGIVSQHLRER